MSKGPPKSPEMPGRPRFVDVDVGVGAHGVGHGVPRLSRVFAGSFAKNDLLIEPFVASAVSRMG